MVVMDDRHRDVPSLDVILQDGRPLPFPDRRIGRMYRSMEHIGYSPRQLDGRYSQSHLECA